MLDRLPVQQTEGDVVHLPLEEGALKPAPVAGRRAGRSSQASEDFDQTDPALVEPELLGLGLPASAGALPASAVHASPRLEQFLDDLLEGRANVPTPKDVR